MTNKIKKFLIPDGHDEIPTFALYHPLLLVRLRCNLCYVNLYITICCISPVDNGEQNSKYWDYFWHDRCCHTIDFNFPLLGQDFIFVVTYSPLKSMVVDNIMLLIVQLNDGKKDNLRWIIETLSNKLVTLNPEFYNKLQVSWING